MNNLSVATNNDLEIFHTACGKSELLTRSHYHLLIYVAIFSNHQKFLMELRKDYTFVARYSILDGRN